MKDVPLISIITPTLNSGSTIEACIKSVADQTFKSTEHLIIDGRSTDRTLEIVREYQKEFSHLKVVSEKDDGIYDAMNKGVDLASGEWIFFLGSDDTFYDRNVISKLLSLFGNSKLDIIYGDVIFTISGQKYDGKFTRFKLFKKNLCHQSIFTRKTVFNTIGKFDLRYKSLADYHFNIRCFNNNIIKHKYTDHIIAYFNEKGFSFKNKDKIFAKDWNIIISTYVPFIVRKAYQYRDKKVIGPLARFLWDK